MPMSRLARVLDEFILAMTLLTRIPMPPARNFGGRALARAIWAYPLVGALIGAIGAAIFWVTTRIGVAPLPAAVIAISATILSTGCFHEDGLADFWDGIGGGKTIEHKLEIMRDSRIGSYGAAALILSITMRAALVAELAPRGFAEAALVLSCMTGRAAIAAMLLALTPARTESLATTAADPPLSSAAVALAWPLIGLVLVSPRAGLAVIAAAACASACMIRLIRRQIQGYTGDALGATEQTVEIACLIALTAATGA